MLTVVYVECRSKFHYADYRYTDSKNDCNIIEQVAWNKSSLLRKILKLNTQTLQLFTMIIKVESIYKSKQQKVTRLGLRDQAILIKGKGNKNAFIEGKVAKLT